TDLAIGEALRPFNRSPAELRLYEALDRKVSLEVTKSPLKDVIAALSGQARVPLLISQKKLEEANVQLDAPITKKLRDVPLRAALKTMLGELGLDFIIHNDAIL